MTQLNERIATLEAKLKTLKARQQQDVSRKRTLESRRTRKADTRRKILIGAIVLARVEQGRLTRADLKAWLDQALTRSEDRELFGLPVRDEAVRTVLQPVAEANNQQPPGAFQLTPAKSGRQ